MQTSLDLVGADYGRVRFVQARFSARLTRDFNCGTHDYMLNCKSLAHRNLSIHYLTYIHTQRVYCVIKKVMRCHSKSLIWCEHYVAYSVLENHNKLLSG